MASIFMSGVSSRFTKRSISCSGPSRPPLNPVILDLPLRPLKQSDKSHPHICKKFRSLSDFSKISCLSSNSTSSSSTEEKNIISENVRTKQQILKADVPWLYACFPEQLKLYARAARLDQKSMETGWFDFPILWSIPLAANPGHLPDLKLLGLFQLVGIVLKAYANTINDFVDRDIDRQVERSKNRPFASGEVTPFQGLCVIGFELLLFLSAGTLLNMDKLSFISWATTLLLFTIYPYMKRFTYCPQAFLGLCFASETLFGWQAVKGSLDLAILLPLFAATAIWVMTIDTIYGHQDKKDDLKAGAKSMALLLGDSTKIWLTGFSIVSIGCFAICGFNAHLGWPFYAFLAAASGQLAWQIGTVDLSSPADCGSKFLSNLWFAALIFAGIIAGRLII